MPEFVHADGAGVRDSNVGIPTFDCAAPRGCGEEVWEFPHLMVPVSEEMPEFVHFLTERKCSNLCSFQSGNSHFDCDAPCGPCDRVVSFTSGDRVNGVTGSRRDRVQA
jgi:hypothetical protein